MKEKELLKSKCGEIRNLCIKLLGVIGYGCGYETETYRKADSKINHIFKLAGEVRELGESVLSIDERVTKLEASLANKEQINEAVK